MNKEQMDEHYDYDAWTEAAEPTMPIYDEDMIECQSCHEMLEWGTEDMNGTMCGRCGKSIK